MANTTVECNQGVLDVCTYKGDTLGSPKGEGLTFQFWSDDAKTVEWDLTGTEILVQVKKSAKNRTFRMQFDSTDPGGTWIDMSMASSGIVVLYMTADKSASIAAFPKNPDEDEPYVFDFQIKTPNIVTVIDTDIDADETDNSFNRGVGDWLADGLENATSITVSGFTDPANNGDFTVVDVTASKITVSETLVTEASGASITVTSDMGVVYTYFAGNWQHTIDVTRRET